MLCLQTPSMAICDANLVDDMPRSLTCFGGLDALVHGLESYVSVCATDFTKGASLDIVFGCTCVVCGSTSTVRLLCCAPALLQ
jgi:alcohol dehydrogenase YqhD (iron-dependent ADH family)